MVVEKVVGIQTSLRSGSQSGGGGIIFSHQISYPYPSVLKPGLLTGGAYVVAASESGCRSLGGGRSGMRGIMEARALVTLEAVIHIEGKNYVHVKTDPCIYCCRCESLVLNKLVVCGCIFEA